MNDLKIGMFGAGVVGGGVYELIEKYTANQQFANNYGVKLEIVKICVQHMDKERDFKFDRAKLVAAYDDILKDPSINCIVEAIGGIDAAKYIILQAIQAGKHVVTANKALIAACLPEIQAELDRHPNVRFAYEAAVCGSIPIIHSLQTDYVANTITKVVGIMNGTTNFILDKMEEGADYSTALTEAQRLGFAEESPENDVEGYDVRSKVAILAKLAFGQTIPIEQILTTGITQVAAHDFNFFKKTQSTIKLIAVAAKSPSDSTKLSVYVSPMIVSPHHPLASVKGPGNMVIVKSENMPCSAYSGPGAGRYPTANAVLNDIVRIAQDKTLPPFPMKPFHPNALTILSDYTAQFYIRFTQATETPHASFYQEIPKVDILSVLSGLFNENQIILEYNQTNPMEFLLTEGESMFINHYIFKTQANTSYLLLKQVIEEKIIKNEEVKNIRSWFFAPFFQDE